jgi:hypothetical protein
LGGRADRKRVRQELRKAREDLRATKKQAEISEPKKGQRRKKALQQEILRLERELRTVKRKLRTVSEGAEGSGSQTGALPDFVVIGAMRSGTSFFYYLLTQHPFVEPAAAKELHFFDHLFDEGVEWYKRCFPQPGWEGGRWTITGEATPYMTHKLAPERMAQVAPQARLIALLRNPVDRAYSHYQRAVRKGRETRTFEEAIEEEEVWLRSVGGEASGGGHRANADDAQSRYLSKGIYVDQLLRWLEFFDREQLLVLRSEDFFESPHGTLLRVFEFLGLPEWKPEASETTLERGYEGTYETEMDPSTRRRLEEYFEPHNRRLYDYLGVDFGW